MIRKPKISAATIAAVAMLPLAPLGAQQLAPPPVADATVPAPAPGSEAARVLTVVDVEARLAAMEADTGIEDAVKEKLRANYQQAIESLKGAADDAARAAGYADALETAPAKTAELRAELEALPPVEDAAGVKAPGNLEELQKEVEAAQAALAAMKVTLEKTSAEWTRVKGRPIEISDRMPQAQRELVDTRAQLASPALTADSASPGRVADRTVLEATAVKLAGELAMLAQEQQSQTVRERLLQAQSDLIRRQVENAAATLDALEGILNRRLAGEAMRVVTEARATLQEAAGGDAELQGLAAEVEALAKTFEGIVGRLKKISAEHDDITDEYGLLTREAQVIREQLKLGRAGGAMAQRLFELRQRLPGRRVLALHVEERRALLGETRLEALDLEEKLREQEGVAQQFADRPGNVAAQLLAARQDVLAKLETQYGALIRALAALAADEATYLDEVRAVRAYLDEELFWVKSSSPVGSRTLTEIPGDLQVLFGIEVWPEVGRALAGAAASAPIRGVAVVIAVLGLLLARRRIGTALEQTGTQLRRISADRYGHTGKALLYTLLLALPVPLAMAYIAWALGRATDPNAWLGAASDGLLWSAVLALALLFMIAVYRRKGLGIAHFEWREESVARLRKTACWFAAVYVPAFLVTRISFSGDAVDYFDSLGRTCFLLAHVWAAVILWQLFQPWGGILTPRMQRHPGSLLARSRYLWFSLVMAFPLFLVLLACVGYLFTAVVLSLVVVLTAAIAAGGVILYWSTLRWFMIRERKLALAEAIEERRARREAAAVADAGAEGEPLQAGEVVSVEIEDELDLSSIGAQTRHLLEFLFVVGVVVAIGMFWRETVPVFSGLDKIRTGGGLSLLNLGQASLIIFVTAMAWRNLPGLLELAVFGGTEIERGTRVAIVTLCQYALVAVGLTLLFGVLNVDWAKFGWIAAALSVGLGFGLQEVVANFVCGLILLFERPVRVGDVVTVEGTTGTVSRIRMRATTIINWDRQEFVVPNKTFVTGTILNWTLSNSINRVVVAVGVAYGSATEKARQILLDVAADHPIVLDDPSPLATFEEFADSTLTLRLRAYLPNTDNRLRVITELHAEIDKRFAEAGIEIAFPQRDLHVRSVEPGVGFTVPPGSTSPDLS